MSFRRLVQRKVTWIGTVLLLAAGFLVLGPTLLHTSPPPGVALADLNGVDQLQTRFNHDRGVTRMVMVVSPT